MHILIVDDKPYMRVTTKMLLQHLPDVQQISEAGDGCEALDFTESNPPDLILMDIRMPFLAGVEATRQIKMKHPEIQIIALSYTNKFEEEVIAAGADKFVLKKGDCLDLIKEIIRSSNKNKRPTSLT